MTDGTTSTPSRISEHRPAYLTQTASRERRKGEPRWQWEEVREEIRAGVNAARKRDRFRAYSISYFAKLLMPYMEGATLDDEKVHRLVRLKAECILVVRDGIPYSAKFHLMMDNAAEKLKPKQLW